MPAGKPHWRRAWRGNQAYSDTKLRGALLAFPVARRWPGVRANALEPGWVPTKMGGAHATEDLDAAHGTWRLVDAIPAVV